MNCGQNDYRRFGWAALVFTLLSNIIAPAVAEENPKPAKWRPTEGIYASPGKNFNSQCGEFGDVVVELSEHSIGGNEWGCKVTKLTDTAPNSIRMDMICNDYNLAENINDPNPEERKFREIMLLRKMDEKSIMVRKTLNGKFDGPAWRASYCPAEAQRLYSESKIKNQKKVAATAELEQSGQKIEKWRPRDGVYANPGVNFNDQCSKPDAVIIELAKDLISSDGAKCKIFKLTETPTGAIELGTTCNGMQAGQTVTIRQVDGRTIFETPGTETVILNKVDDKTLILRRTKNGTFIEPDQRISYCQEDAQRLHDALQH